MPLVPVVASPSQSFRVLGLVTLDGAPMKARLEFSSGSAVTDDSGHYDAVLPSAPRDLPIRVFRYPDQRLFYTDVPTRPLVANQRHDIHIETVRVDIVVVDSVTRQPIPSATVTVTLFLDAANGPLAATTSNGEGKAIFSHLPKREPVIVCATAEKYLHGCTDSFTLVTERGASVTVALRYQGR